ncbi:MAG: potassium-transporting ATPase subunit KdpA [Planctomycetes bacterium]|nr:potassium-transporting ATPase subunit KdpA [Planctomycetota bacterium]
MSLEAWMRLTLFIAVLVALGWPLGAYLANVAAGKNPGVARWLAPLERGIYRIGGVDSAREMTWKQYALALLAFQLVGVLVLYALQRLQGSLPFNPAGFAGTTPDLAFDTAISFVTNTNWQSYGGETTMSHFVQAVGLGVQNFVSAATGIAVFFALARGFQRASAATLGNFWADMVRSTVHVLLPLSVVLALALVSQGVVQTLAPAATVQLLEPTTDSAGAPVSEQTLALGPVASQVAIKQLGTNGGGFFNVNSAHPFENPTPLSNYLELLAILLLPVAACSAFGRMAVDRRQGRALLATMILIFVPLTALAIGAEERGNPKLTALGADQFASEQQSGGNLEGKEVRFGAFESALWSTATTAASNGSVNSMHDSYTPLGGLAPMVLMQLGEVVFGGVGSGLYGLVLFALVAVFLAGLMVGRTPEYLGKKIERFEVQMASLGILAPCFAVLVGTALAVSTSVGRASIQDPGVHGFSEVLYAFSSAGNNNGSAFAGLNANVPFYNVALGFAMLIARYLVALPVIAIAGTLAAKKKTPESAGTLPTHGALFVGLLVGVVLLVGALTFLPSLAIGPIVEHLQMIAGGGA